MGRRYRLEARLGKLTDGQRDRLVAGVVLVAVGAAILAAVLWP
jgi:hypothetical protein